MALIECSECGKSISDKAAACPGCGCPINIEMAHSSQEQLQKEPQEQPYIQPQEQPLQVDFSKFDVEQLWYKAFHIHHKGNKKDLPTAIEIYKYIVDKYNDSAEAAQAAKQLEKLKSEGHSTESNNSYPQNYKSESDTTTIKSSNKSKATDTVVIPVYRYRLTAILGFPLGTGLVLGTYFRAKKLIKNNDYVGAKISIDSISKLCWAILVLGIFVALIYVPMILIAFGVAGAFAILVIGGIFYTVASMVIK